MASATNTPRIVELAARISTCVAELQDHLSAQGVPSPSFAESSPTSLPANVSHLQDTVLDATAELYELLLEPLSLLFKFGGISNMVSIDAMCRFQIPDMIPPGGQVSFEEIAKNTGLERSVVRRLVRHAISMRILEEPEPGRVAHTKISKFLTIPYINAWVSFESKDTWPASTKIMDAIEKWPSSEAPNETGFSLANNTDKSVFEVLGTDPTRAMRFGASMQAIDHVPGYAIEAVAKDYDWESLGHSLIVNIGGSRGQAAIELARNFKNINLIVQDAAMAIQGAETGVPDDLQERIQFEKHELFDPQTIQADVYFFRLVFRTWGDQHALRILKAQIPALRPGAKILIQDACMPEPGTTPLWRERIQRGVDLSLKCYFNGRERYLDEWKALLEKADERFLLYRVIAPKGSLLGFLEIHWVVPIIAQV